MTYAIDTILYATDRGPRSLDVLNHAVGMARRFGARLHLVTVIDTPMPADRNLYRTYLSDDQIEHLQAEAKARVSEYLQHGLAAYDAEHPDHPHSEVLASVQILEGNAAELLLEQAAQLKADLIVLGSHGQSPLGEMLIGSVAHKVTMRSRVPVLLVPINQ